MNGQDDITSTQVTLDAEATLHRAVIQLAPFRKLELNESLKVNVKDNLVQV